ncbi:hypothetical protein MCOR18_002044, partial [Pyricularia oryzae]
PNAPEELSEFIKDASKVVAYFGSMIEQHLFILYGACQPKVDTAAPLPHRPGSGLDGLSDVRKKLAGETTDEARVATLSKYLCSVIAGTMQLSFGAPPRHDVPLMDYGIDSLVAGYLRTWFLGELLDVSVRELCERVFSQVQTK